MLESFLSLYQNTSFHKMTVKDICKEANINRSTFYEYFIDIYDVLDTIENSIFPPSELLPQFNAHKKCTVFDIEQHLLLLREQKKSLKILFSERENNTFRTKFINYIKPIVLEIFKDEAMTSKTQYTIEYTLWGILGAFEYYSLHDEGEREEEFLKSVIHMVEKTTF
ncbi:MAG: TetR/AcrR family transcriptional regulator [Bacillota bacterium]